MIFRNINTDEEFQIDNEYLVVKYAIMNDIFLFEDGVAYSSYLEQRDSENGYDSLYTFLQNKGKDIYYHNIGDERNPTYLTEKEIKEYAEECPIAIENDEVVDTYECLITFEKVYSWYDEIYDEFNYEILDYEED